ncbi:two component transcriptional regulator, LuxR family [Methylocella silvestris BL2]|uniref:Two component transcriptional regulator, LuxR family n=1 Tax=Methylocella silvestris (strain DSM 15510 / CIP 108128 / LMG 27833 / NCIMB 13906 / BL2) TaxID=395965 RepID=B8EJQ4_METSB|nr:response regulator transcription factor [Methylocella silvestris]ACK49458.1 two component transcriptional regulator, LuxR family [Methylocella silvestris BL2]
MRSALIIEDHPILLQASKRLLEDIGVSPVFVASDVLSGYRLFHRAKPDVVIVDLVIKSNGLAGLDLIRRMRLRDQKARILVFSMHADPVIIGRALEAGAMGYVVKDAGPDEFIEAFKRVDSGKPYLSNAIATEVALVNVHASSNPLANLSRREIQTLALLAEGKSYRAIADELRVSYKTVVNVCSLLRRKLGAGSLAELIALAVRHIG